MKFEIEGAKYLDKKYMFRAMDEMRENINTFMHECWDDVEDVGTDFHVGAERMTLEDAANDLDQTISYYNKCRSAGEEIEHTCIIDIVIAAEIVFDKLEE